MPILRLLGSLFVSLGLGGAMSHAAPTLPVTPSLQTEPAGMARLIISRDRTAPNACDVELSLGAQLVAQLPVGESVTLQVPAGELTLGVALSRAGYCAEIDLVSNQSILISAGETRRYQVMLSDEALFLAPRLE